MAGLIERKAKTPITIKKPTGSFVDGKPAYDTIPDVKCMVMDMSQEDFDYFGKIDNGTIFLIAPFAGTLAGCKKCQIVYDGDTYDSEGIRTLRNMKSEIIGYKVAVA